MPVHPSPTMISMSVLRPKHVMEFRPHWPMELSLCTFYYHRASSTVVVSWVSYRVGMKAQAFHFFLIKRWWSECRRLWRWKACVRCDVENGASPPWFLILHVRVYIHVAAMRALAGSNPCQWRHFCVPMNAQKLVNNSKTMVGMIGTGFQNSDSEHSIKYKIYEALLLLMNFFWCCSKSCSDISFECEFV